MKYCFVFFLIFISSFAQFTPSDSELAKTTFMREFDAELINSYLSSNDAQKINAALLSIAQSEDTSFIGSVTQLDFNLYGKLMAFTLGELGESTKSADYLLTQLSKKNSPFSVDIYDAIGKVGNIEDLQECTEIYSQEKSDGFPLAVFQFYNRAIVDSTDHAIKILLNNISDNNNNEKLFRSLFTLYRVAPEKVKPEMLEHILFGEYEADIKTYALGILRKNSIFPFSIEKAKLLIENDSWSVRVEAARTLNFYPFKSMEELDLFLKLLEDRNPSVSRTAAQSISSLNLINENLKEEMLERLRFYIIDDRNPANARGELLLSLQNMNAESTRDLYTDLKCMVLPNFVYRLLGNATEFEIAFSLLRDEFDGKSEYEQFIIYSNITNFYDSLKSDADYSEFLIEQYSSGHPQLITLNNYLLDSTFVNEHREILESSITSFVNNHISDERFNQALASLSNITDFIDSRLTEYILNKIEESDNYHLQFDLKNQLDISDEAVKLREGLFQTFFSKAFSFKKAVVKTSKGNYTIELMPGYAPISVGNFVHLSETGFYSNMIYHRVVPNFVIQSGDPTGTGWSGPAHTIVSEFSPLPFDTYHVGMASAGKDTEGSQWFVMNNHYPHLNGNYTNFGKVITGFDVVDATDEFDMIYYIAPIK